jgi:hypothetical protein
LRFLGIREVQQLNECVLEEEPAVRGPLPRVNVRCAFDKTQGAQGGGALGGIGYADKKVINFHV